MTELNHEWLNDSIDELGIFLNNLPQDIVAVDFDETVLDYEAFAKALNESLPKDVAIEFGILGEPLMNPYFCRFVYLIERPWLLRTSGFGPELAPLRSNAHLFTEKCLRITAVFCTNDQVGVYPWLRKVALLARVGYNVKIEVPFEINEQWVMNVTHGLVDLDIEVVEPVELVKGYRHAARSCGGVLACIGIDGGFYPCPHCLVANPLGYPVYRYGKLGEPFKRQGCKDCKLKDCPLDGNEIS